MIHITPTKSINFIRSWKASQLDHPPYFQLHLRPNKTLRINAAIPTAGIKEIINQRYKRAPKVHPCVNKSAPSDGVLRYRFFISSSGSKTSRYPQPAHSLFQRSTFFLQFLQLLYIQHLLYQKIPCAGDFFNEYNRVG